MSYKKYYKEFGLENNVIKLYAKCYSQDTSYGFHHCCEKLIIVDKDTLLRTELTKKVFCQYLNRTWERYDFESVLLQALDKIKKSSNSDIKQARQLIKNYGG